MKITKASRLIYDIKTNSVTIEFVPYCTESNQYKMPMGYSRKIELSGDVLSQEIKDAIVVVAEDNEP